MAGWAFNADGILTEYAEDEPRIAYDPATGELQGLLIEEQRTNILLQSVDLSSSPTWARGACTVTGGFDSVIGAGTAFKIEATNLFANIRQAVTVAASTTYTLSLYVRQGTGDYITVVHEGTPSVRFTYRFSTGIFGNSASGGGFTIVSNVAELVDSVNLEYRLKFVFTTPAAFTAFLPRIWIGEYGGGDFIGQYHYVTGVQLEAGAFATSPIPTSGSAITRTADSATITGTNFSDWYNQDEGTVYIEYYQPYNINNFERLLEFEDGADAEPFDERINIEANLGYPSFTVRVAGNQVAAISVSNGGNIYGADNKIAFVYKQNDYAVSHNGGSVYSDNSAAVPTITRLGIGANFYSPYYRNNFTIKTLKYWPYRASNADLEKVTT
jgi:hypothetical protein